MNNLNDVIMDDDSIYQAPGVLNHPNYFQIEKNVHCIKNFTTKEERQWFLDIAEGGTEEQWGLDPRPWWHDKMLYIGDENIHNPVVNNILQRIKDLFNNHSEEDWVFGGMLSVHRMKPGEAMFAHSDNPSGTDGATNYVQFGMVLYHNDFNGGDIYYKNLGISYKPEAGDLVMHPGSTKYTHGTMPVLEGPNRYVSTTFSYDPKVKRLMEQNLVFANIDTDEGLEETPSPIMAFHRKSEKNIDAT